MKPEIHINADLFYIVKDFSSNVLGETYDRFHKDDQVRFDRIFIGKLGEVVFSKYLHQLGIAHSTENMFEIFAGTENVDKFDFILPKTGELIDIKTAYRNFHQRIMIPCGVNGQWHQMPKDYYVGIKLFNAVDESLTLETKK